MDQISLDTTPVDQPLDLGTTTAAPVSDTVAQSRSAKATVGLGPITGQDYDTVYKQISGGEEDNFRQGAASAMDYKDYDNRQKTLTTLAVQRGRDLSSKEVHDILTGTPTNPDTVVEKAYGEASVRNLQAAAARIDDNVLTEAQTHDPAAVEHYFSQTSDVLSNREYAITKAQNIQPDVDSDPFFSIPNGNGQRIEVGSRTSPWWSALNWATLGITGSLRDEWLSRGGGISIPTQPAGEAIADQAKAILRDPNFQQSFDERFNSLKEQSPELAQQFAMAVAGMSTSEKLNLDVQTAMNVATGVGLGMGLRGSAKAVGDAQMGRNMGDLRQGPDGVYRPDGGAPGPGGASGGGGGTLPAPALQRAQKAVEDVLQASPAAPTKANMAEAAGDTHEAAIQKAIVSTTQPDLARDAVDTLFDLHRANQKRIAAEPGNNSREEHTRLIDAGDSYESNAVDAIENTNKIVRLPALAEDNFKAVADRTAQHFKGKENTIVNIDMVHDPISNTEWHVHTIGYYDGTPFTRLDDAQHHADINGYGKASITGTNPDIIYIPKTAVFENKPYENYETAAGVEHIPNEHTGYVTPEEKRAYQQSRGITGGRISNGEIHLITDHDNGAFITARKEPNYGLVPVEYNGKEAPKFGEELVAAKSGERLVNRSNFSYEHYSDGTWRFHLDDPQGTRSEVVPSAEPIPTHLPFDTKTGKFGEPLVYGPHIVQKGLGFHLKWFMPLNEQDNWLRENHLITTARTKSTSSNKGFNLFNDSFLSYFRLPQDTLSAAENDNRFKLVYGQNRYMNLVKQEMRYVEDLFHGRINGSVDASIGAVTGRNTQMWNDFKRALTVAQKYTDPDTGLPGYYFRTPAEIQHFWQTAFQRSPTVAEQQAYLAVGRLDYTDWVFRNISVFKNKARLGVMKHTLITDPPQGSNSGEKIRSEPFEGRLVNKLPSGNIPVVIFDTDGTYKLFNSMNTKARKEFLAQAGEHKRIQLYNPDTFPVRVSDKDGNPIRVVYVVAKNVESSPVTYDAVGYRGGGHWDYNYDHYVKQPIMRKFNVAGKTHWVYSGDATFAPIKNRADGEIFVSKLNQIRKLLSERKVAEAKAVHKSYLDMPWKDFIRHFFPGKDPVSGEMMPPRFNMYEDFRVIPKGFTVAEYDKKLIKKYEALPGKFVNSANGEQSLARNFQVEYTGARDSHDLMEPYNTGTIQNPMYKFQPAELTDPMTSMVRGLRRIIESQMGDDYKYSAVEHWLQENMDMLKDRPEEIRAAPFHYFMNGGLNRRFIIDPRGQAAESNRYKIKKLIGMPTYMDSQIHMMKQAMADSIFNAKGTGAKGLVKQSYLVPAEWTLSRIQHPTNFVRGMAFHQNLGFWNWTQLVAQNMAYINIVGLSPDHALPGIYGAWMHLWSRINKAEPILNKMSQMAETFGWKPGEWKEAMEAYDRSGFGHVANTLAIHDPKQQFMISKWKELVQRGTVLFDLAEQNIRHGAWYTAYHEWKRAFPNKPLNDVEIGKIGSRANDLYANMGRDSKTLTNTGIGSVTLQFFKYQENVAHLFFSKRIGNVFGSENNWKTRARQRAQMIALYALAFGPIGAIGLTGAPIPDAIRKSTVAHGYVPGSHIASSLMMEGPASMAGAYLSGFFRTGKWDMSKGTFYNFNNRYGANGYQLLRDLVENSDTFWGIVLGASGSTMYNNLRSISPFVYAWTAAYNNEPGNAFQITMDDWKNGADNINTARYVDRLQYALRFGKWLDRTGRPQQDVGKIDAIFRTLTGSSDVNLDDLRMMREIEQDRTETYKKASQDYMHYMRLQADAIKNNDPEQAKAYGKNANWVLQSSDVPLEEQSKIFAQTRNLLGNTQDQTYDNFYQKYVPTTQQPAMDKAYQEHYGQKH